MHRADWRNKASSVSVHHASTSVASSQSSALTRWEGNSIIVHLPVCFLCMFWTFFVFCHVIHSIRSFVKGIYVHNFMFAWWELVLFSREKQKFSSSLMKRPLLFQTGTLTEEGLDVWGVMEGGPAGFSEMVPDPRLLPHGHMLSGLACCHTVTLFKDQPLGDPLELKMIESTGWVWTVNLTWFQI